MKRILLFILCATCTTAFGQKFDNLALTPPMGWNSWNKFATRVDEKLIKEIADAHGRQRHVERRLQLHRD